MAWIIKQCKMLLPQRCRVTHICVAWSAPSHYLNQCCNIVIWTLKNDLQSKFNRNTYISIRAGWFLRLGFCAFLAFTRFIVNTWSWSICIMIWYKYMYISNILYQFDLYFCNFCNLVILVLQIRTFLDVSVPGHSLWILDWTCYLWTPLC